MSTMTIALALLAACASSAPSLAAAPDANACKLPFVAYVDDVGDSLAGWRKVREDVLFEPAPVANDAAALAELCARKEDEGACDKAAGVYVDNGKSDRVYAFMASGDHIATHEIAFLMTPPEVRKVRVLSDRYVAVSLFAVEYGRSEGEDCDDPDGCLPSSYEAGLVYVDAVIDRQSGRLVWKLEQNRWDDLTRCATVGDVRMDGETFVVGTCQKTPLRFTLADARPCTTEVRADLDRAAYETADAAREGQKKAQPFIEQGRKHTKAKRWDDAIAAFDKALALAPDAGRALSGRGYARLGKKDYAGADADFVAALARAGDDTKFRAAVLFNRGLVAEGRGDKTAARAHFQAAHDLQPSAATAKKLGLPAPAK